jgi:hypothetical protein
MTRSHQVDPELDEHAIMEMYNTALDCTGDGDEIAQVAMLDGKIVCSHRLRAHVLPLVHMGHYMLTAHAAGSCILFRSA